MKHNNIIALCFLAVIISVAILTRIFGGDEFLAIRSDSALSQDWLNISQAAVHRVLRGTKYEHAYTFNQVATGEALEFLLFDSRNAPPSDRKYRGSCAFLGGRRTILCDVAFVDNFLVIRDLDKERVPFEGDRPVEAVVDVRPLPADELNRRRQLLLMWILGHELGHVIAGHGSGHFGPGKIEDNVAPRSISQQNEVQADAFIASAFVAKIDSDDMNLYYFLIEILQNEINRKACPDISPLQFCKNIQVGAGILEPTQALTYLTRGTHPEYIIRLLRLIDLAHSKYDIGILGYFNRQIIESYVKEEQQSEQ
jgi:hypothetical protein